MSCAIFWDFTGRRFPIFNRLLGQFICPQTSVTHHQPALRNISKEHRSYTRKLNIGIQVLRESKN